MNQNKQIIYIDESGIHKITEHSSFVLVCVNINEKVIIQDEIIAIEKSLGISHFHWSDFSTRNGWDIRRKFVQKVIKLPFTFKYTVIENPINSKEELQKSLFTLLYQDAIQEINIDGKQPKWFERKIKKSLRDRGLSIQKVKTVDDKNEPIIRLADALANVVRIFHDNPKKLIVELFNSLNKKNRNETTRR